MLITIRVKRPRLRMPCVSEFTGVLGALEKALAQEEPVALATVVWAKGSSYRRAGARMVFGARGPIAGRLSAGCVEKELGEAVAEVLASGEPRVVEFDHTHPDEVELGWKTGCPGAMRVLVEGAATAWRAAEAMRSALDIDESVVMSTDLATAEHSVGEERDGWFVEVLEPPPVLLVCGDGPEAAPLGEMGAALGWRAVVLADPGELPRVDERVLAVVCSHDFTRDGAFLRALADSPAAYVGLVGARARAERLFAKTGVDGSRARSPAGLDIGADSPDEIALSIVAEMLTVLRDRGGGSLSGEPTPIH